MALRTLVKFILFCLIVFVGAVQQEEEEFEQELLHVFDQYDTNGDQVLTREEMFATI